MKCRNPMKLAIKHHRINVRRKVSYERNPAYNYEKVDIGGFLIDVPVMKPFKIPTTRKEEIEVSRRIINSAYSFPGARMIDDTFRTHRIKLGMSRYKKFLDEYYKTTRSNMNNFEPILDRVLIRPDEPEAITPSGLILPDNVKEIPTTGIVLAVGEGRTNNHGAFIPNKVKAGDKVMFGKFSGTEIKINGEKLVLMRDVDVIGVIQE